MQSQKIIFVKRLPHGADLPIPQKMTLGSSGCDIAAAVEDSITINPGDRALVPTGFCFEIPQGYEVQVRPRSGLAWKHGLTILNTPGTIDSDYRGEVKVILANLSKEPFIIRETGSGTRIAVERLFDQHNIKINVRMELGSNEAIKQAIVGGLGLSILSRHTLNLDAAMEQLAILHVEHFPIRREWYAVHHGDKQPSMVAATFLKFLHNNVGDMELI